MRCIRVFLLLSFGFVGYSVPMQEHSLAATKVFSISNVKVLAVAFVSTSVCCVATLNNDLSSLINFYDVRLKKTAREAIKCPGQVTSMTLCDNLKKIAVSLQNRILVFDVETAKESHRESQEYKAHTERVNSISAHPSFADVIISGSDDKTIKVWDLKKKVANNIAYVHESSVTSVRVSGKPHYFVSGFDDKTTIIWDWKALKPLHVIKQVEPLSIEYNQEGDRFMICANHISRYDATTAALVATINRTGQLESLRGSQIRVTNSLIPSCASTGTAEQELIALGADDGKVALCYPEDPASAAHILQPFSCPINALAFCPNGTYLVAGSQIDQKLQVYELPAQKEMGHSTLARKSSIKGCFGLE